mgnify:CR=1 FL=1
MKLSVGQVVFLLTAKSSKVYPALVCEEIKKKSLSGETTNYVVRLPTEDKQEVEIGQLDAEVFETIGDARETILSRVSERIDKMLESAAEMSQIFSGDAVLSEDDEEIDEQSGPLDSIDTEDFAIVDLGDGKTGRLNVKEVKDII